jgi:hypothetical protein
MALSNKTFTLVALVSTAAIVSAVGCTVTEGDTGGVGGSTTTTGGSGGTTSNGGSGGTTSNGGSGGMAAAATCTAYCAANVANCSNDSDTQWATANPTPQDTCEDWCTLYDQGTVGEMTGDTLECRMYHTGAAAADPATHCSHSGPFGGGVCGASQCQTFCAAMQLICTGTDEQFVNEAACEADCNLTADNATGYVANNGTQNAANEAFACRGYHLSAALDDPGTHCDHAAGDGTICQ